MCNGLIVQGIALAGLIRLYFAGMSFRLAAFLLAISIAGPAVLAQRAATIDTITPQGARPCDAVTITGNGFGAINVRIAVGSVPAPVLTANGNSVTFRVPAGVPQGATSAREPDDRL